MDFRLPALGEGIDSATVVAVKVSPGDVVADGQDVIDVETDKAAMSVAIDAAGTVGTVAVKPGDKLAVGAVILTLSGSAGEKPAAAPTSPPPAESAEKPASPPPPAAPAGPTRVEFKLPNLGEGIDAATVVAVHIKPGDTVTDGQDLIDVETDKAAVSVPSDVAGKVEEVRVKTGDKIPTGAVIAVIMASSPSPLGEKGRGEGESANNAGATSPQNPNPRVPLTPNTSPQGERGTNRIPSANGVKDLTPAGPATRRLARELGVALREVKASGRAGRVTLDDVKTFVRSERAGMKAGGSFSGSVVNAFTLPAMPDFGKFGPIEKKPASGIRKKIAENLTVAWRTMPMVTQNDLADITDTEAGRKKLVDGLAKGAAKITWTVLAVKACVAALKEFPTFNSSYDMNAGELILKKYFHIGIAVDTERGLVVPVVKDADKKSLGDIAAEITAMAEKARAGKLAIDDMRGGTFTITNLGGIGGTSFTPIVNYPEVAILGMCRSSQQPVVRDGQIVPRLMLPLSLTYDHRVIDGADGARFTSRLAQLFSDPSKLLSDG